MSRKQDLIAFMAAFASAFSVWLVWTLGPALIQGRAPFSGYMAGVIGTYALLVWAAIVASVTVLWAAVGTAYAALWRRYRVGGRRELLLSGIAVLALAVVVAVALALAFGGPGPGDAILMMSVAFGVGGLTHLIVTHVLLVQGGPAPEEPDEGLIAKAWRARREGRLADAEHGLEAAVAAARSAGARGTLIHALRALGHVAEDFGQDERMLALYEEAAGLAREEGDPLLLAHAVRHLGDAHREARRWSAAETCYAEALDLYRGEAEPPPLDFANALRASAVLREEQGERSAARELWSEARALYEDLGIRPGVVECDAHLDAELE